MSFKVFFIVFMDLKKKNLKKIHKNYENTMKEWFNQKQPLMKMFLHHSPNFSDKKNHREIFEEERDKYDQQ